MGTTCKHYNLQQKGGNILKSTDRYFVTLIYFPVVTTDPWLQWTYSKDTLQVHIYLPIYIFEQPGTKVLCPLHSKLSGHESGFYIKPNQSDHKKSALKLKMTDENLWKKEKQSERKCSVEPK